MTTICRDGTSGPAPGFPQLLGASTGAIAALFGEIPIPLAAALGGLLGFISVDLSQLCATDPPADPGITYQDVVDLQDPFNIPAYTAAAAKFYTLFKRFLWPRVCVCTDLQLPTPLPPPTFPATPPLIDPVVISPTVASGCYSAATHVLSTTFQLTIGGTHFNQLDAQLLGGFPAVTVTGHIPGMNSARVIQAPAPVSYRYVITNASDPSFANQWGVNMIAYDSTGAFLGLGVGAETDTGHSQTGSLVLPSGTASVQIATSNQGAASPDSSWDVTLTALCVGSGVTPVQPCCPPDPILMGQLQYIRDMVTLLQRQLAPFGSIHGAVHSGLSGSSHFAVNGLLGCKIAITTLPGALGIAGTSPTEIFDAGFITWNTADGYPHSLRLEHNPQLSLPARCSVFTDLAYDLHPGVVVTITELEREP